MTAPCQRPGPRRFAALLLAAILVCASGPAAFAREARALLIAAGDYDNQPVLRAPRRDADDFAQVIQSLGVPADRITRLGDGTGTRATRTNILTALELLEAESQAGELVIFYYSGHGTQVRDESGDESDQKDEALVPVDVPVRFAAGDLILDDRIKVMIDRLRARGADVWAIFDSCLSGTVTRNAASVLNVKGLSAVTPGTGRGAAGAAAWIDPGGSSPAAAPDANAAPNVGTLVAFFASQSYESALEIPVEAGTGVYRSVFTAALVHALRQYRNITFRQLAEIVREEVSGQGWQGGSQTPGAEGDGLDRVLPGGRAGGASDTGYGWWPVKQGRRIDVGWVGHVETGSLFSMHKTAALEPSDVFAQVVRNGALRSELDFCKPQPDGSCRRARPREPPAIYRFARLEDPAVMERVSLAVDVPDGAGAAARADAQTLRQTIGRIDWDSYRMAVDLVGPVEEARIVLRVDGESVFLTSGLTAAPAGLEGRYPVLTREEAAAPDILARRIRGLWQIDRLRTFARAPALGRRDWIGIEATVEAAKLTSDDLARLDTLGSSGGLTTGEAIALCKAAERRTAEQLAPGMAVTDCDRVAVRVTSRAPDSLRYYLLYYGPEGCLIQMSLAPASAGQLAGLLPPATTTATGTASAEGGFHVLARGDTGPSLGRQGLLLVSLRLKDGHDPGYSAVNHCSASAFRGGEDAATGIVADFLSRPSLRAGSGRWETDDIAIDQLYWTVEPYGELRRLDDNGSGAD